MRRRWNDHPFHHWGHRHCLVHRDSISIVGTLFSWASIAINQSHQSTYHACIQCAFIMEGEGRRWNGKDTMVDWFYALRFNNILGCLCAVFGMFSGVRFLLRTSMVVLCDFFSFLLFSARYCRGTRWFLFHAWKHAMFFVCCAVKWIALEKFCERGLSDSILYCSSFAGSTCQRSLRRMKMQELINFTGISTVLIAV